MAKTVTWAQTLQLHKGLLEVLVVQCAKVGVGQRGHQRRRWREAVQKTGEGQPG